VYAYALLFPGDGKSAAFDPVSRQYRLVYDLYNLALAEGLRRADGNGLDLTPGTRSLPLGSLDIAFTEADFVWLGYRLEHFVSATALAIRGLRNRYWRTGVGAALVARVAQHEAGASVPGARRIGTSTRIPVTAFLRLEDARAGLAGGALKGRLELYPEDRTRSVTVDRRTLPLETDTTAALALWLEHSRVWDTETRGVLQLGILESISRDQAFDRLFLLEPFRSDRIPLVLVHGTYSNPARWAELVNELRGDPRIRDHYQLWLFTYETGAPINYSAGRLRSAHVVRAERTDRRFGVTESLAGDRLDKRIYPEWTPTDGLRAKRRGHASACSCLRGHDSQGRQARRSSCRAADEVRAGHQPQDREGSRPHHPAVAAGAGGPGHRIVIGTIPMGRFRSSWPSTTRFARRPATRSLHSPTCIRPTSAS
jgi:hypothetical protein